VKTYLGLLEDQEQDLTSLQDSHLEGSCQWLLEKDYFVDWRDGSSTGIRFLWLRGKPGLGKSVLSANIVNHLQDRNFKPVYYFFKHGDRIKSTMSGLLRSIAYQMAASHSIVLQRILSMAKQDSTMDVDDDRGIWKKIFVGGIFKVELTQPQYWVVDALDECVTSSALFSLISKNEATLPIRILVTSRPSATLLKRFADLGDRTSVTAEEISTEDTLDDIQEYVKRKSRDLMVDDESVRQDVESEILGRSQGSFLWVQLVMNQLCEAHTVKEMERLVHEPPQEMDDLYRDVLTTISASPRGVEMAKAILTWAICSTRPFTVKELNAALEMDVKESLASPRHSIPNLCGQLVSIDKHDRVQIVHETARHFVLKKSESILGIDEKGGNGRLAGVCLSYLVGSEMSSQQGRKRSSATKLTHERSIFVDYAAVSFFEHVRGANSSNNLILTLLHQFLTTNVLTWIEYIATTGSLQHLIKAAKNFKNFLDRRAKHYPPIGEEVRVLDEWSTDLIRLVAKFGRNLLLAPASIYGLIPPFCPKDSALRKQFGSSPRGINVVGLSASEWDNRLSVMQYAKDVKSTTVAYGPKHFAVGLSIGEIIMYNAVTCQESMKFQLEQKVRFLTFCRDGNRLAACGKAEIRIWDAETGDLLHSFTTSDEPLAIAFSDGDNTLMTATRGHRVMLYDLTSEVEMEPVSLPWLDDEEMNEPEFRRLPIGLDFSPDQTLLAIVYKGLPIQIWAIDDETHLGSCERVSYMSARRASMHLLVIAMAFNPATKELAAAYGDGDIAIFDPETQELIVSVEADAQALACSPSGLTLATGDAFGTIQIWDFGSLELLYTLAAYDDPIHALAFSTDNLRFLDIRGSKCNVWEPSVLVRSMDDDDDQSMSGTAISEGLFRPQEATVSTAPDIVLVTAVACHTDGYTIFVARDDGSVSTYDAKTGIQVKVLYSHSQDSDISVTRLAWGPKQGILASADVSTRVKVWKLVQTPTRQWDTKKQLIDTRLDIAISQILLNPDNDMVLISTPSSTSIYATEGNLICSAMHQPKMGQKWANHPSDPTKLISITPSSAHVFEWATLTTSSIYTLATLIPSATQNTTLAVRTLLPIPSTPTTRTLAIELLETGPNISRSHLYVFSSTQFFPSPSSPPHPLQPLPHFSLLSPFLERLIGIVAPNTLVFLDINLWVCTINLKDFNGQSYTRHFFLPYDWLSASGHGLLMDVVGRWDVLAVRNEEVAVVRRGLSLGEKVEI
jgi:WD40 repeat protein